MKLRPFFVFFVLFVVNAASFAANDYNIRLFANVTGDVEQVVLDPSQFSLTLTNFPNGVRRGSLEFIGSSGGGGTNTVLVAEPGALLTPQGTGTNGLGADFSIVVSNQMTGVQLNGGPVVSTGDTTDFYPRAGNPAGYLTSIGGFTNGNVVAGGFGITTSPGGQNTQSVSVTSGTFAMVQSNNTYTTGTTQSMDVATANVGTFTRGALNGWTTNKPGFATIVVRGTDGSDAYNVDGTQVALVASNNTFTATNNFTAPVFIKGSTVISNSPSIIGDLSVTGTVSAANLSGALNGTNLTGIGSVATNLLARFSNNSGTIGGAGNYLVVTFDPNTGLPIGWTTVQGLPAGASTNAVTFLENANNGNTYNNVNGIIFTNVPYFTQNQSTNTVGFSNVVFDTVQLVQGGTNFVLHGATLSVTNANTQGLAFSLTNGGTLTVSGTISNLTPGAGDPSSLVYDHTTLNGSSGTGTLTQNALGGDLDVQLSSNFTGQAFYVSADSKASFVFKHDTGTSVYTKEFKIGLNTDLAAVWEVDASQGSPGFTFDFDPPHMSVNLSLGQPYANAGYSTQAGTANIIIDELSTQDVDNHAWYPGNNTNFPALWIKAGGHQATSATGAVMNSDWINMGAIASTNNSSLPRAAFIGVASNEDFLAIWRSTGMSTNGSTVGNQYSTNATDAAQFGTNRFAGFLFGGNGTFGAAYSNVVALVLRDDTNGLMVLSVLTNGLWIGTTNNLTQKQVISLP
ncbi:MAG: beta strand repeat-containing protein [Verrucomicrobiia bacterium]